MWKYNDDNTKAVITAEKHIESCHKSGKVTLPKTAILYYMYGGVEYTLSNYKVQKLSDNFPRFLGSCPVYKFCNYDVCFLNGGAGAPQAADTLETLVALGVDNIISVGMFGAFGDGVNSGDILVPDKAFVEEGTSLHYYSSIDFSESSIKLHDDAISKIYGAKTMPIVSTDAVYRQTFYKEKLWRNKGAVGVDMETSALFSVGRHLGVNVVSILIASDKHPKNENGPDWEWTMKRETRYSFFDKCINFALQING